MTSNILEDDNKLKHSFSDEISYSIFANYNGEDDDWNIIDVHKDGERNILCDLQDLNNLAHSEKLVVDAAMEQYKGTSECNMTVMSDDELLQQLEGFQTCFDQCANDNSSTEEKCSKCVDVDNDDWLAERGSEYQYIETVNSYEHEHFVHCENFSASETGDTDCISEDVTVKELNEAQSLCKFFENTDGEELRSSAFHNNKSLMQCELVATQPGVLVALPSVSSAVHLPVAEGLEAETERSSGMSPPETARSMPDSPLTLCCQETRSGAKETTPSVCATEPEEESYVEISGQQEVVGPVMGDGSTFDSLTPTNTSISDDLPSVSATIPSSARVPFVAPLSPSSSSPSLGAAPSSSTTTTTENNLGILHQPAESRAMISFLDFQSGDIALFLPMDAQARDVWSAFNSMKQHHYLSEQSMNVFLPRGAGRDQRVFVLGRIIMIDSHKACVAFNPYRLPLDTLFHVCHVEPLNKCRQRSATSSTAVAHINYSTSSDSSSSDGSGGSVSSSAGVSSRELHFPRISFTEFGSGELALFMLGNKQRNIWMAFHSNRPYHFLSDDSLAIFMDMRRDQQRMFILGRIIYVDSQTATLQSNPYALPQGTQFHVCYVEPVSARGLLAAQR